MFLRLDYPLRQASRVIVAGETPHVSAAEHNNPNVAASGLSRNSRIACSERVENAIRLSAINRLRSTTLS